MDGFLARFPAGQVTRAGETSVEITPETLPPEGEVRVVVLEQAR